MRFDQSNTDARADKHLRFRDLCGSSDFLRQSNVCQSNSYPERCALGLSKHLQEFRGDADTYSFKQPCVAITTEGGVVKLGCPRSATAAV